MLTMIQAVLETSECLHSGTSDVTDATYFPKDQTVSLQSLLTFSRVCCDELDQQGTAPVSPLTILVIVL
jgi:hypothetical protein